MASNINSNLAENSPDKTDSNLVFNLFVYNMSNKVSLEDCKEYLARFGEIDKFEFVELNEASSQAFVSYKNSEVASSVLKHQFHKIAPEKVFSVKVCESWRLPVESNPTLRSLIEKENKSNESFHDKITLKDDQNTMNNFKNAGFLDLDENCLAIIFSFLPLHDQLSLSRSHLQFERAFISYAKMNWKHIKIENWHSMSLWNVRQLFRLAGEFLEKLTHSDWIIHIEDREFVESCIQNFCANLKKIEYRLDFHAFNNLIMTRRRKAPPRLLKILNNKPNLTTIAFNCEFIEDDCINDMKQTFTLEHLSLVECHGFTGRLLYLLPQLKTLRLAHCVNLKACFVQKALGVMPDLRALDIVALKLSKSIIDDLSKTNTKLEILKMSTYDVCYSGIALLPKLRCLELDFFDAQEIHGLYVTISCLLVEKRLEQWESLNLLSASTLTLEQCHSIGMLQGLKKLHFSIDSGIDGNYISAFGRLKNLIEIKLNGSNLKNNALLELVSKCPKLKWINVRNTAIDKEFLRKLMAIIKNRDEEVGPTIFLVKGSKINENDIPKDYETEDLKSLVKFVFDHRTYLKKYDNLYDTFEITNFDEVPFFKGSVEYDDEVDCHFVD